jgi:hypothetical protein
MHPATPSPAATRGRWRAFSGPPLHVVLETGSTNTGHKQPAALRACHFRGRAPVLASQPVKNWGRFRAIEQSDDGDPLDIMVIHDAATFPGIVLTCRIIGILQITWI